MTYKEYLWRSKRILILLYKCFRFSKVMDQMFLTVRGAVQSSFRSTLGVVQALPLFMSSYDQDRELGDAPLPNLGFFLRC